MHFITEDELRQAFQEAPFERYELSKQYRLTPGARGFLFDRRIPIIDLDAPPSRVLCDNGKSVNVSPPEDKPTIKQIDRFMASLWEVAALLFDEEHSALEWLLLALERTRKALAYAQGKEDAPVPLSMEFSPLPEGTISMALFTHPKRKTILTLNRLARESSELAVCLEGVEKTLMEEVTGLLDQGIIALYGGESCQK